MSYSIHRLVYLLFFVIFLQSCSGEPGNISNRYYTWDGLEPDRWASIWLIKRYIDPQAAVELVPVGAQLPNAIAIAIPSAASGMKRSHGRATYENIATAFNYDDEPVLKQIGNIINELEISPWNSTTPAVSIVEHQFRKLQFEYNRVDVPAHCYAGFFDALYLSLKQSGIDDLDALQHKLMPDVVCQTTSGDIVVSGNTPVLEYPLAYVLKLINAERKVVFVDTREDEEFDAVRIPGAINLKLREVNASVADRFADADLVISYCIKDFRGYEVALALSRIGVSNVGIMTPYGLKGWRDMNLPVASVHVPDAQAVLALKRRAAEGV